MSHGPLPSPMDCEIMEWFSRRGSVRWANIPQHWRARVHQLTDDRIEWPRWLEREAHVQVKITSIGRMIAAAYREGRAAAPAQSRAVGER